MHPTSLLKPPQRAAELLCCVLLSLHATATAGDWLNWRGPLQSGESLEKYESACGLTETPLWTYDARSRGCPVVCGGRVFVFGYRGEKEDLVELLSCLDEKTGKKLWEVEIKDFISDTVYNRYAIGSPTVDAVTKRVYLLTAYGVFGCWDFEGKEMWRRSLMEDLGRLTFPNSKVGSPVIEGDLVIVRGITANWGAEGPASDRFYAFDKMSGELVWSSAPGEVPPTDSSFSTPIVETRDGQRVFWCATGCGNLVAVNARNGKALWRFKMAKVGVNATPVLHQGRRILCSHADENVDTADKGRMIAVKLPEKFTPEPIVLDPAMDAAAWKTTEEWRNPLSSSSSSPVLIGDTAYMITDTGAVCAVNAATGAILWEAKVSNGNTHASPCYADGLLYAPLMEGKVFVLNAKDGSVAQTLQLEGNCIGSAAVCNGRLLVHTTEKLYSFSIKHGSLTTAEAPEPELPAPGPPAALQIIPAEFTVHPGGQAVFRVRTVDAAGFPTGKSAEKLSWETFIPPTAKVKVKIEDAHFDDANHLIAAKDAKLGAGAFKATTADGLTGTVRGRVLLKPPFQQDFSGFQTTESFPADAQNPAYNFAYPPLPWIGARFKFQVMDSGGDLVLGKSFDRLLFQRGMVFLGTSEMRDYTMQADVMTDGNRRAKSDVGIIVQRYAIVLKGNANVLEISSNFERLTRSTPFKVEPNRWYRLKATIKPSGGDGGSVCAKVWDRTQQEPEGWTLLVPVRPLHTQGSPGLFGFTPQNQKRVFIDNISVTPNQP
ncbi:MAG: PQQ-binding-like beta-propeller repeat protein [Prosthecobacter sp.]